MTDTTSRPRIAIGSDHAGYELKQHLVTMLLGQGYEVDDQGTHSTEAVDYPPICAGVGRSVRDGGADVGIVLGGSGQGEQLAANKVRGVRAALCNGLYTARMAREHNDANVLASGPAWSASASPRRSSTTFLTTDFEGGRHARRVDQITDSKPSSDPTRPRASHRSADRSATQPATSDRGSEHALPI